MMLHFDKCQCLPSVEMTGGTALLLSNDGRERSFKVYSVPESTSLLEMSDKLTSHSLVPSGDRPEGGALPSLSLIDGRSSGSKMDSAVTSAITLYRLLARFSDEQVLVNETQSHRQAVTQRCGSKLLSLKIDITKRH